jgi:hypothetical protein
MATAIRYNNASGTLGTSLTSGTTGAVSTFFAAAPNFASLTATQFIRITLTPTTPTFEIIHITAFTAASKNATIVRAQEGTVAVAHAAGKKWVNAWTATDGNHAADKSTTVTQTFTGSVSSKKNLLTTGYVRTKTGIIKSIKTGATANIRWQTGLPTSGSGGTETSDLWIAVGSNVRPQTALFSYTGGHFQRLVPHGCPGTWFLPNRWYPVWAGTGTFRTFTHPGRTTYIPFPVSIRHTFKRIGFVITGSVSGAQIRLGIYKDSATHTPGGLLHDFGQRALTASGALTLTITVTLTPGDYWLVMSIQTLGTSGKVKMLCVPEDSNMGMVSNIGAPSLPSGLPGSYNYYWQANTHVTGAFPTTAGAVTAADPPPLIMMRAT